MAKQRKPYNPNTPYGRKKLREQAQEEYENMTPDEQSESRKNTLILFIVVTIIGIVLAYVFGGSKGVEKWLTR